MKGSGKCKFQGMCFQGRTGLSDAIFSLLLIGYDHQSWWRFLGGWAVKNLPTVQETGVQSLSQEDPLEEGMAIHSSVLAWEIPWTLEPARLQSTGLQRAGHDWARGWALMHTLMMTIYMWKRIKWAQWGWNGLTHCPAVAHRISPLVSRGLTLLVFNVSDQEN